LLVAVSLWAGSSAASSGDAPPSIALIIDDLGNQQHTGEQAIALAGPVACAFLPGGHYTRALAQRAHARHKEVMLHLPLQAVDQQRAEPGMLTLDMTRQEFSAALSRHLAAIPHVSGINNHEGSLLTRHPGHMAWLMQAIRRQPPLFFVDSRTTVATVAGRVALEYGVPSTTRNVFLDNERDVDAIRGQFRRLLDIARQQGSALGIGHPHPETLAVLEEELGMLGDQRVQLVTVARLIEIREENGASWQASLSR